MSVLRYTLDRKQFIPSEAVKTLLPENNVRILTDQITSEIFKCVGNYRPALHMFLLHYLILLIMLIIYSVVEWNVQHYSTGFILIVTPFITFIPVVYAMVREPHADSLNTFIESMEFEYLVRLDSINYTMNYLFIPGADLEGEKLSISDRLFRGRTCSGYIEFERKELRTPSGQSSQPPQQAPEPQQPQEDNSVVKEMSEEPREANRSPLEGPKIEEEADASQKIIEHHINSPKNFDDHNEISPENDSQEVHLKVAPKKSGESSEINFAMESNKD